MRKTLIIAGLASTMALSAAAPAFAWRAVVDTGVRRNTANTVREVRDLRNDVRNQSKILIEALRMQTGEQSAYSDKQIEAFKRIQDAGQQNDTDRVRQTIRAEAESGKFDPNPDACLLIDLFSGKSGGESGGSGGAQGTAVIASTVAEKQRIGSMGAAAAVREMAEKNVMINGTDASKRASTFFEVPTVNMNEGDMSDAAESFVLKMMDPIPMVIVPPEQREREKQKVAIQESRLARDSIVLENMAMLFNMSANVVPGSELKKLAEGTPYNREIPEEASELQAIDVMTVRHYAPPPASGSVEMGVTLQKLHQLTAIMARMQYLQLEMDRRNLQTQSAILAKMIESDGD